MSGSGADDRAGASKLPDPGQPRRSGFWGLGLIVSLLTCFAAAAIGAASTRSALESWYPTLNKPSWNPPNQVFGPVWTVLYFTMAVAAWMVWRKRGLRGGALPLGFFLLQLVLNMLWSILFFGGQNPGAALAEIVLLWLAILATLVLFFRAQRVAGLLLLPYLLWVSFAAVLNYSLWQLNR